MNIFQSDNIWKRKAREARAAEHPATAHDLWEKELRSNYLWLVGGVIVVALYVAGILAGAITVNLTSAVVVIVVTLYCLMSLKQISTLRKNEPDLTPAEKKKIKKRK